eukprot:3614532-Amphidinium_carterae.1
MTSARVTVEESGLTPVHLKSNEKHFHLELGMESKIIPAPLYRILRRHEIVQKKPMTKGTILDPRLTILLSPCNSEPLDSTAPTNGAQQA